jgi:signal transduction histidine kinase
VGSRAVAVVAFTLLAAFFVVDALTPQTLVIAILFDIPILLAALTRSRRLTAALVAAAVSADALAAIVNAARDGYRWDPIGIGDRALSILSILMVGYLSTVVQARSERVGRLAAQEARARREVTFSAAADRIRTSLSLDVVIRAIVREAPRALDAERAVWYPSGAGRETLAARDDEAVEVLDEPVPPEISSLAHRVVEERTPLVIAGGDPVGRFVLDRLAATSALALPLADRTRTFGVLFVTRSSGGFDEVAPAAARAYANLAVNALAQAVLFDELAERNTALGQRQAVIHDLVDAISHDVRTPLAALSLTLRQAADGAYGDLPPKYGGVLRDSLVSIDDLQRLAETLLLVARFESGERRPVERAPVDLAELVREVGSEIGAMAESRSVHLTLDASPARTLGSRGDLRRAVINLAANAVQHTPEGGNVVLRTGENGKSVEVAIVDDGFGVNEAARASLFQRFANGSSAGSGTGLGLYIVRRIAEETGGSVRYEPRAPQGSAFVLTLPKADSAAHR